MYRIAIQVDGGFLRARAKSVGRPYSNDFVEGFCRSVVTGQEDLLRILYYDCPQLAGTWQKPISGDAWVNDPNNDWIDELATRELFAVRTGVLKWRGWKLKSPETLIGPPNDEDYKPDFQQKGIDLRIGLDMATMAYERTVDRIVLVAGDTDFVPAMKLARRKGIQVVAVEFKGSTLSREFRSHVDLVRHISISD